MAQNVGVEALIEVRKAELRRFADSLLDSSLRAEIEDARKFQNILRLAQNDYRLSIELLTHKMKLDESFIRRWLRSSINLPPIAVRLQVLDAMHFIVLEMRERVPE